MNYSEKPERISAALDAAKFLSNNFITNGDYYAAESWGPEGALYLAESSWVLMDAYRLTKEQIYLGGIISILNKLKQTQKSSGGWSIDLGKDGICFKITEEERIDSSKFEDPPTTAAFLQTISGYYALTGDSKYQQMGENAFAYLLKMWDKKEGTFVDHTKRKLLGLRANPKAYHLFFLIGLFSWKNYSSEIISEIYPILLESVKSNFESFDINTMPLICGLHANTLMNHCTIEYTFNVIKPKMDLLFIDNTVFKIPSIIGGFGHRDGSRGIVITEAHMRSAAGIAIAMKKFDQVTESKTYTKSPLYEGIASWIDQMKGPNYYFEFEFLPDREKRGYGSPGQYLPCWWIFGSM